jgi:hypothetical protein
MLSLPPSFKSFKTLHLIVCSSTQHPPDFQKERRAWKKERTNKLERASQNDKIPTMKHAGKSKKTKLLPLYEKHGSGCLPGTDDQRQSRYHVMTGFAMPCNLLAGAVAAEFQQQQTLPPTLN